LSGIDDKVFVAQFLAHLLAYLQIFV